jgi:hypothetical protein
MTGALLALVLILSVLFGGIALVVFYELAALRNKADDVFTISTYWARLHKGRIGLLAVLGGILTVLYVFLMGDLVFEAW